MDARRLKRWKEDELARANRLAMELSSPNPQDIRKMYPEFDFGTAITTSLEPYVPLWALLPFFDKVIVGIVPYIRSKEQFRDWYGLDLQHVLTLHEMGRVNIRVLFPSAATTIPSIMHPFFSGEFPSTARDLAFDKRVLGSVRFEELRERFVHVVGKTCGETSIDGFTAHSKRAFKTAQTAFVQFPALGHSRAADQFEHSWEGSPEQALRWLEVCRLFLIGPVHYSLGGIHCVASSAPQLAPPTTASPLQFPAELGRILVDALKLVRFEEKQEDFTFHDCISLFPDFELARLALLNLDLALKRGDEKQTIETADDLRKLITAARSKRKRWLRWMRVVAATGLAATTAPHLAVGLLTGLGFTVATEFASDRVDGILEPAVRKLQPQHLNLIVDLDDAARRHFKDSG